MPVDRVYVLHVRSGAEDRAASIERQLARHDIAFEYVLDGDVEDLTPEVLDRWFAGDMKRRHRYTSCCCKHLLAYSRIVRDGWQDALILEDDIFLAEDFIPALSATLAELRTRPDVRADSVFLSLENSGLKRVPEAVPGLTAYRRPHGRETGAYWIPRDVAQRILARAEQLKVDKRTPLFLAAAVEAGVMEVWWRHPPIAEQGSINGRFDSFLDPKRTGPLRRPRWLARKAFQLYLRPFFDWLFQFAR